jgi:GTP-sensing pleiotropic transcriptional regulator CodY
MNDRIRLLFAYNLHTGEMKRANVYEEQRRMTDRFSSTLAISASIIAAVRLARDDISRPSPRLTSVIADCVGLARMILEKVLR